MTPLRVQALLEPEDSSSSDFVELPEESSPEVSELDGGSIESGAARRGAGEASPSITVTSDAWVRARLLAPWHRPVRHRLGRRGLGG